MRTVIARLTFAALVALHATPAAAHDRGTSYSSWDIRGTAARVVVRLTELDVSRFPWAAAAGTELPRRLGAYLADHLLLSANGSPCALADGPRPLAADPGIVLYEWYLSCPSRDRLQIQSTLLREVSPSHLHFARARVDSAAPVERVLSERGDFWLLNGDGGTQGQAHGTDLLGYVLLGIEHILTGYDHLAFVFALLLLGASFAEVAKVVTGFTVAHSITLAAMVLGYLRPDATPIEALIGLSIALVAAENCWQRSAHTVVVPFIVAAALLLLAFAGMAGYGRVPAVTFFGLGLFALCYFGLLRAAGNPTSLRWAIAFLFGLVHGFGFAAVLDQAGLPDDRIFSALLGFNAGVEIGQLAVVAAIWPLLRLAASRHRVLHGWVVEAGSAAVLALGVFWFLTRTYG
jgi:hypothetical protein